MSNPDILLHKKHQIAFEEIIRQESHKFVTRDTKKKFLDKSKQYGFMIAVPNILAGMIGYAAGGSEGSLEAMKQVSFSVLPYTLALQGFNEFIQSKQPLDNINYVIKQTRTNLTKVLKFVESQSAKIVGAGIQTTIGAASFYGLSLLTEKITGVDFNQAYMALTGAGIGLFNSGAAVYIGNKWRNKISEYAENNVEEIEERKGIRLKSDDLECLLRGALRNPDKTQKIYLASSEKRFRGIGGALGLFEALDKLADKDRDETRVKPNVTINIKSERSVYEQKHPQFTFEYAREKSKTDTILNVTKLTNARSNGVQIEIHPMFRNAPIDEMLASPYENLTTVYIYGKKDGAEYFEIKYDFNDNADKVEVTINSRQHLDIISDLFRSLYGRPIEDVDFDQELVGLSDKQSYKATSNQDQFDMIRNGDPLDSLKPKKENNISFKDKEKKSIPKQPEQPLSNLASLSKIVFDIYKTNKDKIQSTLGYPSLDIAFEGVVYSLSPMDDKKRNGVRTAFHIIGNPLRTVKSLVTDGEVLPSLRKAEVNAQLSGVSRENVYEVIRELEKRIGDLAIEPNMHSIDYDTFWRILDNPKLLVDKAHDVELVDKKGTKITLHFGETKQSYKIIRDECFPSGDTLKVKAEEFRQAREARDFSKVSIYAMFGKSRIEKELENPTYEVVADNGKVPGHVIMYKSDDNGSFMQNRTVHISTKDMIFMDKPVHPNEGIKRVTNYLIALRDSIQEVVKY
ncbi:MAG: hypothetical protein WC755_01650 [Candidatus Woesearchaeota archaeon]|jgi:hypothetical protein